MHRVHATHFSTNVSPVYKRKTYITSKNRRKQRQQQQQKKSQKPTNQANNQKQQQQREIKNKIKKLTMAYNKLTVANQQPKKSIAARGMLSGLHREYANCTLFVLTKFKEDLYVITVNQWD